MGQQVTIRPALSGGRNETLCATNLVKQPDLYDRICDAGNRVSVHLLKVRSRAEPPCCGRRLQSTLRLYVGVLRLVEEPRAVEPVSKRFSNLDLVRTRGANEYEQLAELCFLPDRLRMQEGRDDRLFDLAAFDI